MHAAKLVVLIVAALVALSPSTVRAFPVSWGASWDGPGYDLQSIVNNYLGVPNAVNVQTDYIGHDPGEPDYFYWRLGGATSILVYELANNSHITAFGWYRRPAGLPSGCRRSSGYGMPTRVGLVTVRSNLGGCSVLVRLIRLAARASGVRCENIRDDSGT